jgi:hypothetical protein
VYVGVYVGWFSVLHHMWIYAGVCGCMCGVVQCTEPYVDLCECMWVYVWGCSLY